MNINEDIRNKKEKRRKMEGGANKISYISAARCSLLSIWYIYMLRHIRFYIIHVK